MDAALRCLLLCFVACAAHGADDPLALAVGHAKAHPQGDARVQAPFPEEAEQGRLDDPVMERVGAELVKDALGQALPEEHPADGRADLELTTDARARLLLGLVITIQPTAQLMRDGFAQDVGEEIRQRGNLPFGAHFAGAIGQVLIVAAPHIEQHVVQVPHPAISPMLGGDCGFRDHPRSGGEQILAKLLHDLFVTLRVIEPILLEERADLEVDDVVQPTLLIADLGVATEVAVTDAEAFA